MTVLPSFTGDEDAAFFNRVIDSYESEPIKFYRRNRNYSAAKCRYIYLHRLMHSTMVGVELDTQ